jgi:hypothetical protein
MRPMDKGLRNLSPGRNTGPDLRYWYSSSGHQRSRILAVGCPGLEILSSVFYIVDTEASLQS